MTTKLVTKPTRQFQIIKVIVNVKDYMEKKDVKNLTVNELVITINHMEEKIVTNLISHFVPVITGSLVTCIYNLIVSKVVEIKVDKTTISNFSILPQIVVIGVVLSFGKIWNYSMNDKDLSNFSPIFSIKIETMIGTKLVGKMGVVLGVVKHDKVNLLVVLEIIAI